jgi:hypothetical protein
MYKNMFFFQIESANCINRKKSIVSVQYWYSNTPPCIIRMVSSAAIINTYSLNSLSLVDTISNRLSFILSRKLSIRLRYYFVEVLADS